jgi:putative transcriptional regulator
VTLLRHHPHGETLISHAAGALDPAFSAVLSCHFQFCDACRRRMRTMNDLGGVLLENLAAQEDEAFFVRTMDRYAREIAQNASISSDILAPDPGNEVIMPAPLARATGLRRETIPWEEMPHGAKKFDLPKFPGSSASARVIHIEPGAILHSEKHGGQLVLVLWGAYDFDGAHYARGDLHDMSASGFKTFKSASPEGVTFFTAISPIPQFDIIRTAH